MTTTDEHGCHGHHADWERVGRAAERFARRVADDAKLFAERVEEHVTDFARNLRQEWRTAEPFGSGDDVRRVFEDVGAIVRGVVDGVDELISGLFRQAEGEWTLVVLNREATCGGCGKKAAAGSEAWVRKATAGTEFRCGQCGVPGEKPPSA